jgi:hypothetical protein
LNRPPPLPDKDLAIDVLEEEFESRSPLMVSIKVDPLLDSLRDDHRFKALLKKFGFEEVAKRNSI